MNSGFLWTKQHLTVCSFLRTERLKKSQRQDSGMVAFKTWTTWTIWTTCPSNCPSPWPWWGSHLLLRWRASMDPILQLVCGQPVFFWVGMCLQSKKIGRLLIQKVFKDNTERVSWGPSWWLRWSILRTITNEFSTPHRQGFWCCKYNLGNALHHAGCQTSATLHMIEAKAHPHYLHILRHEHTAPTAVSAALFFLHQQESVFWVSHIARLL